MNYKQGYKGDDLKQYQTKLGITADGIFGKQTDQAVRDFQAQNNLTVDGIIGKNTIGAFSGLGQKEDKGINVTELGKSPDFKNIPTTIPTQTRAPNFSNLLTQAKNFYKEDEATKLERQRQQGIVTALQGQGGRADIRNQLGEDIGLEDKRIAMQNASNKLTQLQAEEDTIFDRYKNEGMDRAGTRTTRAWQSTRSREERDISIKKRYAAADLLAAQGDYNGARDQINQAVEDTFADRQDKLTASREQLKWLDEETARATGKQDKELNLAFKMLDREEKQLEKDKKEKNEILQLALNAKLNGASDEEFNKIKDSETLYGAMLGSRGFGGGVVDYGTELQKLKVEEQRLKNQGIISETTNSDKKQIAQNRAIKNKYKNNVENYLNLLDNKEGLEDSAGVIGTVLSLKFQPEVQDWRSTITQMLNKETINQLKLLKEETGAVGQTTEREWPRYEQAATSLWGMMNKDDNEVGHGDFTGTDERLVKKKIKELASHQMKLFLSQEMPEDSFIKSVDNLSAVDGKDFDTIKAIYERENQKKQNNNVDILRERSLMQQLDSNIKKEEGFSPTAYRDGNGYSVGYGFQTLDGKPVTADTVITREQADKELVNQIKQHSSWESKIKTPLNDNQKAALASFEYNLGSGIWSGKKAQEILKSINNQDFYSAAMLMKDFNHSKGVENPVLTKRRLREGMMLMS